MRIHLIAVGRLKAGPERALYAHYASRLRTPVTLEEVPEGRGRSAKERMQGEAARLAAAVPKRATVVALDARGRALASAAFAHVLGRWRDAGVRDLAFLVGGADGLDRSLVARADLQLSLGPPTWPHFLVRGLLAEQLYRAECILSGHPYHRG